MKKLIVNQKTIVSIILILVSFCFITETTYSEVTISEIMYGSEIRFSPKQWIEIANTGTEVINLTGWTLTIQNIDSEDLLGPVTATINFRDATFDDAPRIWPNDFLLIVTSTTDENSGDFMEDQVYDLRWREDLGISFNTTWLSAEGFHITLQDKDGNLVDEVGNYDGSKKLWDLPYDFNRGRTRDGNRTSLIRLYDNGVALDGTLESSWVSAADANLPADQLTYYGDENDISSPGILGLNTVIQKTPDTMVDESGQQMQEISIPITISEIMYGSEIRFSSKQWIEISNTGTEPINLTGWTLTIQNIDSEDLLGPVTATINFRDATFDDAPRIWPNNFLLIVTSDTDENSGGFMEDQVYDLRWREDLGISFNTTWLSAEGFHITLQDKDGNLVDEVGNYDGSKKLWDLPYDFNRGRTRDGNRTSLIRLYDNGAALDGTLESSWVSAADANLTADQLTYYGDENDISSPGIIDFTSTKPEYLVEDVNEDGDVNILDLVSVANKFGQTGKNRADVNGDGFINILDLVRVAGAFGKTASAPSLHSKDLSMITAADVEQWLSAAQQLDLTDTTSRRGILFLQQLLTAVTPKKTVLLANYPNPFNPETWIPYHLAKDAKVTLHIYAMNGTLVRTLPLGHQAAGVYQNRSRAAYWDGKNAVGESVASGVYFYTLTAGDFTATRKMLIRK